MQETIEAPTQLPTAHDGGDNSRRVSQVAGAAALSALTAACGGGGGGGAGDTGAIPTGVTFVATTPGAARFVAQATPGATKADIDAVVQMGYGGWIEDQFAKPRSQSHFDWLMSKGYDNPNNSGNTAGLDNTLWRKLIGGDDPLRQRMVLALSEILVVGPSGIAAPFPQFAVANYVDLLEANAFGNYRQLLQDVTLSTAMGYFLTYKGNVKANGRGSQPDENYARELMQLFTIGLLQLNEDGTVAPGNVETYTQADVSGLARVWTGWDIDTSGLDPNMLPPDFHRRPMSLIAARHETGAKSFLGVTIPAGTPGMASLNMALDTVFNHPNTPQFVSKQLIQRLVTSNPSPGYVARVAAAFRNNGAGERGDLKAVLRAILLDPESRTDSLATNPSYGKLREPIMRFLQWARAFKAASPSGAWAVGDLSDPNSRLGQSPLRSPSVFNFFRPGYVPPSSAVSGAGLVAPEFQLVNESTIAGYLNYMQSAIQSTGSGGVLADVRPDYSALLALATNVDALLAELNLVLAANQLSPGTLATIKSAVTSIAATNATGQRNRVLAAMLLVLGSPEYLVQK